MMLDRTVYNFNVFLRQEALRWPKYDYGSNFGGNCNHTYKLSLPSS